MSLAVATTGALVKKSTGALPATKTITANTLASPTVVSVAAHGLIDGDFVRITGSNSVPSIDGYWRIKFLTTGTFSIPVAVTTAGTAGTLQPPPPVETVAELVNLITPKFSKPKIPTTTHNDGRESNVLGIIEQADAGFVFNQLGGDVTHQHVWNDFINVLSPVSTFFFAFPSGMGYGGDGRIGAYQPNDVPVNAAQQVTASIVWSTPVQQYFG